jgi:hypothetical protein
LSASSCPEHGEKVYFFCEDDEAQLCVVCREAGAHAAHTVRFLEDAAGPYRVGEGTGIPEWSWNLNKRSRAELWSFSATLISKFFPCTYIIIQTIDLGTENYTFVI